MSYQVYAQRTATIASGQTTSAEVNTRGLQPVGIHFPAAMTGATVTIQRAEASGGTFGTIRTTNGASALTITVTAGAYVPLDPWMMLGVQYLKIVSASAEAAQRDIAIACAPVIQF